MRTSHNSMKFSTRYKKLVSILCMTCGGSSRYLYEHSGAVQMFISIDAYRIYLNSSAVTIRVNHIKQRPNLLVWYTADEPDGTSDPLDATLKASNLVTSLDGGDGKGGAGYHPISLVLNCENFYFTYVPCFSIILASVDFGFFYMFTTKVTTPTAQI